MSRCPAEAGGAWRALTLRWMQACKVPETVPPNARGLTVAGRAFGEVVARGRVWIPDPAIMRRVL